MAFTETVLPRGKVLYKGFETLKCTTFLRDTRMFYLTESSRTARNYGTTCQYRVKRTLRLFDLTHSNIEKLLSSNYPISRDTRGLLRVVLGTGVKVGEQVAAVKVIMGEKGAGPLPKINNTRRGQRLSYKELNRLVFGNLSREFLSPEGYDGYYAPKKPSIFHGGSFHSEIMLTNAYQSIERTSGSVPVVSRRSLKWALPRIFMDYCKRTTRLIRGYGGLIPFCTGGMAIRLYLQQKKKDLPEKIRRTQDFDFTFAVPHQLPSDKEVSSYAQAMRRIMTAHLMGFIRYLNREYSGINARLKLNQYGKTRFDLPRIQVPGTGRKVYQVISYQIITGRNEAIDLVDTALAVYPGANKDMIDGPLSKKLGIPIQKLKYQIKDALAILSGSFIYRGVISQRNPLTGVKKDKGAKNVNRVIELLKVSKHNRTLENARKKAVPLLKNIMFGNIKSARQSAKKVNRVVRKIK
jgi:hypothetical protein